MERRQPTLAMLPRNTGVFLVTCALHVLAIYAIADQVILNRGPLLNALDIVFIPSERPAEPPPPALLPALLSDAFADREFAEVLPPTFDFVEPEEPIHAIHAPPPPEPTPLDTPQEGQGYGPLIRPQVVARPDSKERYPRASIRHKETGRTVIRICISEAGTVDSVDVAESSGYTRLDGAAMDIAWDYVFTPAMRDGEPVPVCLPYNIRFRIGVGG